MQPLGLREWKHDRLTIKVNPEWLVRIDDRPTIVKLHLKKLLTLNQRLADPVLYLLNCSFGPSVGGPEVALVDVHRGRVFTTARRSPNQVESVVKMQAVAFVAGWAQVEAEITAA